MKQSVIVYKEKMGTLVPLENGKSLCGEDFLLEAKLWAQNHRTDEKIVLCIGLGAGFHVREWLEQNEDSHLIIIDSRDALFAPFEANNKDLRGRFDLLSIHSLDGLLQHEIMDFVAQKLPPVFSFMPSFGSQKELFELFFSTLTGRSIWGLRYYMKKFGFSDVENIKIECTNQKLTIKDLGLIVEQTQTSSSRVNAVRILKELVI